MTHRSGPQQRGHSEHKHAHPEGEGDVLDQHLEHHNDAGVVRAYADTKHDCGHDLTSKACPELGQEHRDGVEKEHSSSEVESLRPELVQDRPKHDLAEEVAGAHHAEQDAGVLCTDSKLQLRPVSHEGVGGEDS